MKKIPTTAQNADRFVHAIFCDDIRHEVGNKVSFMGCYQGELFVPFVPIMLPKLCVQVTISTTIKRPLKSLTVRLDQGESQLGVIEVPTDTMGRALPPPPEDSTRISHSVGVILAPFNITEPCVVRVVVITEEGEMPGPRLRLKVMPQAEAVAMASEATRPAVRKGAAKTTAARNTVAKRAKPLK